MSTQPLLDLCERQPARAPRMATHAENLARVSKNIAPTIREFFATKQPGDTFHLGDLTAFVWARHSTAGGSPDRVLRLMRKRGDVNYQCVKRDELLYVVLKLEVRA